MWTNLVLNPVIVKSIFGKDEVTLFDVVLHKIEIDCSNGWEFKIDLDLNMFPSNPPNKWIQGKYNTARIVLGFLESNIEHFQNIELCKTVGNLYLNDDYGFKKILFKKRGNCDSLFELKCKWIRIISLTGYLSFE